MASEKMTSKWTAMQRAVSEGRWDEAGEIATDLSNTIDKIVKARQKRGHLRERARAVTREGLYAIGWQLLFRAPTDVRAAIERFNRAVMMLPGGVGGRSTAPDLRRG